MESCLGLTHLELAHLIKQCLQNAPEQRPGTEELLTRLKEMRAEVEGEYGYSLMKMDVLMKMKMAKVERQKDRQIEELTQQLVAIMESGEKSFTFTLFAGQASK